MWIFSASDHSTFFELELYARPNLNWHYSIIDLISRSRMVWVCNRYLSGVQEVNGVDNDLWTWLQPKHNFNIPLLFGLLVQLVSHSSVGPVSRFTLLYARVQFTPRASRVLFTLVRPLHILQRVCSSFSPSQPAIFRFLGDCSTN
jgi:hypothetical protein